MVSASKVKKDPVTPDSARGIEDTSPSLSYLSSVAFMPFWLRGGYFSLTRDVIYKPAMLNFSRFFVSIFLESSNCEQIGDWAWIVIARADLRFFTDVSRISVHSLKAEGATYC